MASGVLLLDLHGFADRSTFLAASRRIGSDVLQMTVAADGGRAGAYHRYADIIVIQHESISILAFLDFRSSDRRAFLSPKNGLHGILNVDIFGGGSWQSDFSM